jgi:hypothetical protein
MKRFGSARSAVRVADSDESEDASPVVANLIRPREASGGQSSDGDEACDCSFGFRPGRNAHHSLDQIQAALKADRCEVYDAGLASYFDTINHARLVQQLERRVADRSVLRLIRLWQRCPLVEEDDQRRRRTTHQRQGTPEGGVISPLLANT